MPVWRPRPDWLLDAVGSVLAQDRADLELIVIDDGSPEPVADVLAAVADPRLRVVRVPHEGVSAARNAGVEAVRGDHVRFVDADDVCEPGSTAHLLSLVYDREDVIAYGATVQCDSELRPVWTMTCDLHGDVRESCLLGRLTVRIPSMLFPTAVLRAAGPWDPAFQVSGDWDLVLRTLDLATVVGDHRPALRYRRHPASTTSDKAAGEWGARRVVMKYFERHPEQLGTPLERRTEAMLRAMAARVALTHGEPRRGLALAAQSLATDPRALGGELRRSLPALLARWPMGRHTTRVA